MAKDNTTIQQHVGNTVAMATAVQQACMLCNNADITVMPPELALHTASASKALCAQVASRCWLEVVVVVVKCLDVNKGFAVTGCFVG